MRQFLPSLHQLTPLSVAHTPPPSLLTPSRHVSQHHKHPSLFLLYQYTLVSKKHSRRRIVNAHNYPSLSQKKTPSHFLCMERRVCVLFFYLLLSYEHLPRSHSFPFSLSSPSSLAGPAYDSY
ncbi:hypothetical protein VPH35_002474 [Triticum aestivum]